MHNYSLLICLICMVLVGCKAPGWPSLYPPPLDAYFPFVENIESPQEVKAGASFGIIITISAVANPHILTGLDYYLVVERSSSSYVVGIQEGKYHAQGGFIGQFIRYSDNAGTQDQNPSQMLQPVGINHSFFFQFDEPGEYVIYIGGARNRESGGFFQKTYSFLPESEKIVYTPVTITVVP